VNHHQPQQQHANAAVSDGTYEKSLVLELCPPGGVKPVPPPDKLANFARSIPNLSPDLICPILLDCLEDGQPWIIRAKALVAIETAIQAGGEPYQTFFHACHEEIAPLTNHARPAIAEPAGRVMALLGLPATAAATARAAHVAAPPAAAPPNLMDFGEDDYPPVAAPAPAAAAPPVPAPAPAFATSGGGGDMFGGMQLKATAAPPAAAATAPIAAPSLLDFDVGEPAPAAPPVATNNVFSEPATAVPPNMTAPTALPPVVDMFGQLSVKNDAPSATAAAESAPPAAPAAASSAFGFINGGAATANPTTTTARPVFDPLSMSSPTPASPNSQAKRMTMSPEQMQAMAYQQMRMQQMMMHNPQQQLQMAMAMQQMQAQPIMFPTAGVGGNPLAAARGVGVGGPFSFAPPAAMKPVKMDDKKFDFVKDAMQTAGTKK
jgi:hypothetical protein